jgi:hypothetical protein
MKEKNKHVGNFRCLSFKMSIDIICRGGARIFLPDGLSPHQAPLLITWKLNLFMEEIKKKRFVF